MNSKERVQTALDHKQPDRCPVCATYVPETEEKLRKAFNTDEFDLGVFMGNDMVKDCVGLELSFYGQPYPEYTDDWGIKWRYVENKSGVYTEIADFPLAGDKSKLDSYKIPDPNEDSQYDRFRKIKKLYGKDKYLIGSSQISIFEASWYLRGLDTFMMDMAMDADYANTLMDKVMAWPLNAGKKYAELGADMIWFGDDISMQTALIMSPDMYRQYLKPRYQKMISEVKAVNPNVKIAYHTCGNCWDLLDDFIEAGIEVLNPVQPKAIDPIKVKQRYGKRLSLYGAFDIQEILPLWQPVEIKKEVKRLIDNLNVDGGFILSPAHHIQADTPIENIVAFYEEALGRAPGKG